MDVGQQHSGKYTCESSNAIATDSVNYELQVLGKLFCLFCLNKILKSYIFKLVKQKNILKNKIN